MNELIKVRNVEPLRGHWIPGKFSDGAVKDVDVSGLLEGRRSVRTDPGSRELLEQVRVNPETGRGRSTSIVMSSTGRYQAVSGVRIERRIVPNPTRLHTRRRAPGSPGGRFLRSSVLWAFRSTDG